MVREVPLVALRLRLGTVVLVAATITLSSVVRPGGVTAAPGPLGIVGVDKWLHASAYAFLAIAIGYALVEWDHALAALVVVIGVIAFGAGVELLQTTVPHRAASPADLLANAVGATFGAIAWYLLAGRVEFHRRSILASSRR